jgi:hypothetical protein
VSGQMERLRPRFSRTLSAARWSEYRALLTTAREHGYSLRSLEDWLEEPGDGPTVILRHDVDQDPRAALRMAAIEEDLGVRSTWYVRWRTAHPALVGRLRRQGHAVGLHYETLSRWALGANGAPVTDEVVDRCRQVLAGEVRAFAALHGPIRSICPHGDTRVPGVRNAVLVHGMDLPALGLRWDGNEAMRGRPLGYWLTDRSAPAGRWKDGQDAGELIRRGVSPLLCIVHPNNWSSGLSLWADRALRKAFPAPRHAALVYAGSDDPPLADG